MNDTQDNEIRISGEHLYSARFDDHYACDTAPEAQKHAIFCEGNDLPRRFSHSSRFTIGELGFGSGLGFLVTAKQWLETTGPDAQLDFISIEGYPLNTEQLTLAQSAFPELADISQALLTAYPSDNPGFHRLSLFDDRIRLTLVFSDVLDALDQIEANVDAWYLDGFAPSKNPDMWQPPVFTAMNRLSSDDATFATYTAASQVRRDLQDNGFAVEKVPGFGLKRERLAGRLETRLPLRQRQFPWKQRTKGQEDLGHVTILGGGIAGCACANRLAARGVKVTIIEKEAQLAGAASSNPVAITHPHFTIDQNLTSQLALQGYLYTLQTVDRLQSKNLETGFQDTGMVVLPRSDKDFLRHEKITAKNLPKESLASWHSKAELTEKSGTKILSSGWEVPQSGWLSLSLMSRALVSEYPNLITVKTGLDIEDIRHENGVWNLINQTGESIHTASTLILANAYAMHTLAPVAHFPLIPNRGQVNYAYAPNHGVGHTLCAKGYLAPLDKDHLCFGSSYHLGDDTARIDANNHLANQDQLRNAFPQAANAVEDDSLGWSGIRTSVPDRMPVIGQVAKDNEFRETFAPMFRGEVRHRYPDVPYHPELFICTGLGSRSVAYSMICGEALAAEMTATPQPLPRRVRDAIDANRFLMKK